MFDALRVRGILRTAVTWAVGLSALGTISLILGVELGLVPASVFGIRELVAVAVRDFVAGGVAGAIFAHLVAWREKGQTLRSVRYRSLAGAGFVAGAVLGAGVGLAALGVVPAVVLAAGSIGLGLIGAGFATGTLALARRALPPVDEPRLKAGPSSSLPPLI